MRKLNEFIGIDPDIRFGKPCVIGTRIAVGDILSWFAAGMTETDIIEDFPELRKAHIRAALTFAAKRDAVTKTFVHEAVA
jgi:uncharacterized protein (DUF433 family)